MPNVTAVTVERIEAFFLRYPFPTEIRYVYSGGKVENMDASAAPLRASQPSRRASSDFVIPASRTAR